MDNVPSLENRPGYQELGSGDSLSLYHATEVTAGSRFSTLLIPYSLFNEPAIRVVRKEILPAGAQLTADPTQYLVSTNVFTFSTQTTKNSFEGDTISISRGDDDNLLLTNTSHQPDTRLVCVAATPVNNTIQKGTEAVIPGLTKVININGDIVSLDSHRFPPNKTVPIAVTGGSLNVINLGTHWVIGNYAGLLNLSETKPIKITPVENKGTRIQNPVNFSSEILREPMERLMYTMSKKGPLPSAFQIRAASPDLSDTNSPRTRILRHALEWNLPIGLNVSELNEENAPVSLRFGITTPGNQPVDSEKYIAHKVFSGQSAHGRNGNYFIDLETLPLEVGLRQAISLLRDHELWIQSEAQLEAWLQKNNQSVYETSIPPINLSEILTRYTPEQTIYIHALQKYLPLLIEAHRRNLRETQSGNQQKKIVIVAPSQMVADLIWGLAYALPEQDTHNLSVSTYECQTDSNGRPVKEELVQIVGTVGVPKISTQMMKAWKSQREKYGLPSIVWREAIVLDCYNAYNDDQITNIPLKISPETISLCNNFYEEIQQRKIA